MEWDVSRSPVRFSSTQWRGGGRRASEHIVQRFFWGQWNDPATRRWLIRKVLDCAACVHVAFHTLYISTFHLVRFERERSPIIRVAGSTKHRWLSRFFFFPPVNRKSRHACSLDCAAWRLFVTGIRIKMRRLTFEKIAKRPLTHWRSTSTVVTTDFLSLKATKV